MVWGAVAIAGASVVSGYLANRQKARSDAEARAMFEGAMRELDQITPPGSEERKLVFEELKSQGIYEPELEQAVAVRDSELQGITTDPRFAQAQMDSLAKLGEYSEGGLTAEDRAALEQINSQAAAENKGMQDAVMQNMRSRGLGSSGMEAALRSQAAQSASDSARQQAMTVNAQAQRRALEALDSRANLAGSIRSQDFGEQVTKASAQDAVNRFREQNLQGVNTRNVNRSNEAQQQNLAEKQRIADSNTATRNYNQEYNMNAERQAYLDELAKQEIRTGNTSTLAGMKSQSAADEANMYGNIIQGGAKMASSYYANKDKK